MAKGKNVATVVTELATPICEELGLVLWDVIFAKEGASWFLRIIIDKDGGVGFTDCENLSRALDKKLDEIDPIDQAYYLEVSSPGIGRVLNKDWHFQNYLGKEVVVKTIRPVLNRREFVGTLLRKDGDTVTIETTDTQEKIEFDKSQLSSVKASDDIDF